jgi:hypothetical protein
MKTLFITLFLLIFITACSSQKKNEKYYQTNFCEKLNGIIEYRLKDNSRVDCLTNNLAIEVDWAKKWPEAIGQSLYYSHMTNKKAAIALIASSKDDNFINRASTICKKFDIKIFIIEK